MEGVRGRPRQRVVDRAPFDENPLLAQAHLLFDRTLDHVGGDV
jgi:hypothetical protein